MKRYLVGEGVPEERIFVAAHAVENEAYNRVVSEDEKRALSRQLNIAPDKKVVLYLGRLEEIKGLPYLVQAFAFLQRSDSILVLAGMGSEKAQLEQLVQRLGITDNVRFAGYVPTEKALIYYAMAYVFVLPSITVPYGKEPWGLVVNEAFNQGVPVIATDAVGAAAGGLVRDGINGFIVAERDSTALAHALQRILDRPVLREQLGEAARRSVADWDNERMVLGFRNAIEYVMRART
ncbi:MAG: glycosyltransferase family 4 protein [Anaerolineae bacterium]